MKAEIDHGHRRFLNIREVAQETGLSIPTIKRYSSLKLITAPTRESYGREGFKGLWSVDVVEEISRISELKKEGLQIEEIREKMKSEPKYRTLVESSNGYYDDTKMLSLIRAVQNIMPSDVNQAIVFQATKKVAKQFLARVERLSRKAQKVYPEYPKGYAAGKSKKIKA